MLDVLGVIGSFLKLHRTPTTDRLFILFMAIFVTFGWLLFGDLSKAVNYTPGIEISNNFQGIGRVALNIGAWWMICRRRSIRIERH